MDDSLTPSLILEELAENVAVQIERNAPVAFDIALKEMSRYHHFLLQLNAPASTVGKSFNYSEISGSDWRTPHEEWIGHYRRLFERAANRIPDDNHFIRSLAYTPHKLLPGQDDLPISQEVTKGIIDLGPLMMHMIEIWVNKKKEVRKSSDGDSIELRTMAGSNGSAYSDFFPHAISAWEHLLLKATFIYRWQETKESDAETQWKIFQESWPFIWQHLINTARCLCIAVWNEDEIATKYFRDALVRWKRNLKHDLRNNTGVDHVRLPFPDMMSLSWPEAKSQGISLRSRLYRTVESPEPRDLFAITVHAAFEDVLLLTSTVLLSWTSGQKQSSDIGARTASALLQRQTDEHQMLLEQNASLSFRELFVQAIRLNLAGAGLEETTYGATLDRLIGSLDRMTERMVVPGRVFRPSTFNSRHELVPTIVSILAAHVPDNSDDEFQRYITHLANAMDLLPDGDSSLRGILDELILIHKVLSEKSEELVLGTHGINPDCDTDAAFARLLEIVERAQTAINEVRDQRLRDTPIDPAKMQGIEAAMQAALQDGEGYELYFQGFEVQLHAELEGPIEGIVPYNYINKATLTTPPLEPPSSNFEGMLAAGVKKVAGDYVWAAFTQQSRTQTSIDLNVINEGFWQKIKALINDVGPDPVLVLSHEGEASEIMELRYASADELPNLDIKYSQDERANPFYLATIEGIDVFSSGFSKGTAWLFSANKLKQVQYSSIADTGKCVDVKYEPDDHKSGKLNARFYQQAKWSEGVIYEITKSNPVEEVENAQN